MNLSYWKIKSVSFMFLSTIIALNASVVSQEQAKENQSEQQQSSDANAHEKDRSEKHAPDTFQVQVLDPDGKPIAGVNLYRSMIWQEPGTDRPQMADLGFKTADQGTAKWELPQGIQSLRVWVNHDDYVPMFAGWDLEGIDNEDPIPKLFTFHLQRGTTIGGNVVDDKGQPIVGARVEVHCSSKISSGRVRYGSWLAHGDDDEDGAACVTDQQGRWTLNNAPSDEDAKIQITITHPDYIDDQSRGEMQKKQGVTTEQIREQTATIVMARGVKISGTVTDQDGQPVRDGIVVWGDDPYYEHGTQETYIDETGKFETPPLPPGENRLTVVSPGWAPQTRVVDVTAMMEEQDFELKPGKTLRIMFVDQNHDPISPVGVGIQEWGVAAHFTITNIQTYSTRRFRCGLTATDSFNGIGRRMTS